MGGAYWRNLAKTVEPSMCGGDAAFLSSYFDHLLLLLSFSNIIMKLMLRIESKIVDLTKAHLTNNETIGLDHFGVFVRYSSVTDHIGILDHGSIRTNMHEIRFMGQAYSCLTSVCRCRAAGRPIVLAANG